MSDAAGLAGALAALPGFSGVAWRAVDEELTVSFRLTGPAPATRSLRVATENFAVDGVYLFMTTSARDISLFSAHPSDAEIVLMPGSTFVPATGRHVVEGIRVQVLFELPPANEPVPVAVTDEQIALWVREARAAPEVPVFSPGKFGASPGPAGAA